MEQVGTNREYWLYRYKRNGEGVVEWLKVRELTAAEYEQVAGALHLVSQLLQGTAAYVTIVRSDLDNYVESLRGRLADRGAIRKPESWLPELRYRFIAAGSALRMHEEAVEAAAQRASVDINAVKSVFHQTYDASLDYRVIYALRNLLVHGATKVLKAGASARLLPDGQHIANVTLRLDRAAFANSSAKASVRGDVAGLLEDPDLLAMADSALESVQLMQPALQRLIHPDLDTAIDLIYSYIALSHEAGGGGPHFHEHDEGRPFEHVSHLHMNEAIFGFVIAAVEARRWRITAEPRQ